MPRGARSSSIGSGKAYRAKGVGTGRLESQAVPGFWLDVGWLFQQPLPSVVECLREVLSESGQLR